eukprot:PITA_18369
MTREAQKQRSMTGITKRTCNKFSALENEIECSICNNFGHEDSECRSRFWQTKEQAPSTRTWRIKEPQLEICGIAFYAEGQENQWYIDSRCSKHMTGDKEKHEPYSVLEKGKKVSFGNDTPAVIKGKRHYSVERKGKTVIKGRRTQNNLYIFEEGQQQCYLSKDDEHWLWHRRLGHLSFSQIRKACKYQAVRGLLDIKIPDNTICKSCQFGKKTRTNFPEKEGSASRPLELVHTDGEAALVAVVIINKTNVRVNNTQTPHELWHGETPSVKHFKIFGSKCYIKNNDEQLGKLEPRADGGILLGYSPHIEAYKCYNKRLGRIVANIDVVVDEKGNIPRQVDYENIEEDEDYPSNQTEDEEESQEAPEEQTRIEEKTPSRYVQKNHPESQILGQKEAGIQTRRTIAEASSYLALLSSTKPQNVREACKDEC